jgi:hypothetical protein
VRQGVAEPVRVQPAHAGRISSTLEHLFDALAGQQAS